MAGEKPNGDGEASTIDYPVAHPLATPVSEATLPASRDSTPALDLQPGGSIGRYHLVERLGAGAMGVVWSAQDPQLDRKVAIKLVHPNLARSADASSRLLREARAMAKLSHRAVVTVHDAGDVEGRLFLAMELVDGTTLGQIMRARTDEDLVDWRKWLGIMTEAGRGLEAAHGAGVLHRDFKPDNVLVAASGRVCVGDFGLATLGDDRAAPISERASKTRLLELTTTGALLGTPAYMSPQQLRGEPIDARADQFNFCVATYEALYGRRPFAATGTGIGMFESLERAIVNREILPAPKASSVPPEIHDILRHGLAPNPDERFPSMSALLRALDGITKSKRTMTNPSIRAVSPRRGWIAPVIGVLAIAGVVVFAIARRTGPPAASSEPHRARKLFDVSLKTHVALSPDAKLVVLGSDRLEVREIDGSRVWTAPVGVDDDIYHVAMDARGVTFGLRSLDQPVRRWSYAGDNAVTTLLEHAPGLWIGDTLRGHAFYVSQPGAALRIEDGARIVRSWVPAQLVEVSAVSPDGARIATIEADRFSGQIVIYDVRNDTVIRSPRLDSPTALAWQDATTIVYATGTTDEPRIYRAKLERSQLAAPEVVYATEYGWFGEIAIHGNRLLFVEMAPKSRARVVDRSTHVGRDLDAVSVAAALAWTRDDEFLTWSRSTHRIERRTLDGKLVVTSIELAGEPANATLAGDVLIAAVRGKTGRDVIAYSLETGTKLWTHAAPSTLAVRCASDRKPPCFALRRGGTLDELVSIDPATGTVGDKVLHAGMIEDLAIDDSGTKILLAMRSEPFLELAASDGAELARYTAPMTTARSVAYDRDGILVAGTVIRNTFQVGRIAGGEYTIVAQAENDLLSFVRPSPDGERILMMARVYAPVLWLLDL